MKCKLICGTLQSFESQATEATHHLLSNGANLMQTTNELLQVAYRHNLQEYAMPEVLNGPPAQPYAGGQAKANGPINDSKKEQHVSSVPFNGTGTSAEAVTEHDDRSQAGKQAAQNEQAVFAQPNASNGHDTNGRIPQSHSYTGFSMTNSPDMSPQREGQRLGLMQSPHGSHVGTMTEPRNYAPRTSNQIISHQPPPPFKLSALPSARVGINGDVGGGANDADRLDPFSTSAAAHANAMSMAIIPAAKRSDKLNELLNCAGGKPSFEVAMHPDNFPFTESCRTGKAINHGVVKIRNVCSRSCTCWI
jgi:hypothetical protein